MKTPHFALLPVATFLLLGAPAHAARRTETVEQIVPAAGVRKIRLENVNGDVRVIPGAVDRIRIKAEKSVTGGDTERLLSQLEVKVSSVGGTVEIETRTPKRRRFLGLFDLGGASGTRVDYLLEVPADREVDLVTVNGAIETTGLTASLKAETVNGNVRVSQPSGSVTVTTVNGGVRVDRKGTFATKVETVNGDVEIDWPRGGNFAYDLETLTGRIEADFGSAASGTVGSKSAQGRIGTGGIELHAETVNGSIRIRSSN